MSNDVHAAGRLTAEAREQGLLPCLVQALDEIWINFENFIVSSSGFSGFSGGSGRFSRPGSSGGVGVGRYIRASMRPGGGEQPRAASPPPPHPRQPTGLAGLAASIAAPLSAPPPPHPAASICRCSCLLRPSPMQLQLLRLLAVPATLSDRPAQLIWRLRASGTKEPKDPRPHVQQLRILLIILNKSFK